MALAISCCDVLAAMFTVWRARFTLCVGACVTATFALSLLTRSNLRLVSSYGGNRSIVQKKSTSKMSTVPTQIGFPCEFVTVPCTLIQCRTQQIQMFEFTMNAALVSAAAMSLLIALACANCARRFAGGSSDLSSRFGPTVTRYD